MIVFVFEPARKVALDIETRGGRAGSGGSFYAPLLTTRALVIEKNGGGAVGNLLTIVALASMPAIADYNASKAASPSSRGVKRAAGEARQAA